jgi:hypothetical protein
MVIGHSSAISLFYPAEPNDNQKRNNIALLGGLNESQ